MHAPRFVLAEMGEYEECLAQLRRAHRQLREARGSAREAAQREHERALQRAREVGARLVRELDAAAHAA